MFWWVGTSEIISEQKIWPNQWKRICDLTTYIILGPKCQNFPGLIILCIQKVIEVNHWFSQSVLSKHCFDRLGTCELISEQKLRPNQWKKFVILLHISHWGSNVKKIPVISILFIQIMITVNHWFSQSVLSKNCFDGLGTSELISEHKLQQNQWKQDCDLTKYIKLGL